MAVSSHSKSTEDVRPYSLPSSLSFSRYEPQVESKASARQELNLEEAPQQGIIAKENAMGDVFDRRAPLDGGQSPTRGGTAPISPMDEIPEGFDELPIELLSLTDRFVTSLTNAKIYPNPPSIETLVDLYQDFYLEADSHVSTHVQIIQARQNREISPTPSTSSKSSARGISKLRQHGSRDTLEKLDKSIPEQQMLTASEISDRRRARRLLEYKRVALAEAIERRACEGIYEKIWRHKSTLDEVRDEKLRSRTAALALVGIGLKDLGIDLAPTDKKNAAELAVEIETWITKAREGLVRMNEARSPAGKLQHLAETHQEIVSLLTSLHHSSSSADEILPTLIYTLITSPPEGLNVISNLHYVQRFRSASRIDGEAAYCLTNLEAAITFLENVDLPSLRADEAPEGPSRISRPETPRLDAISNTSSGSKISSTLHAAPSTSPSVATLAHATFTPVASPPSPSLKTVAPSSFHSRRLSNLLPAPVNVFNSASDAVRTTADQGFKNIGNTLDSSFKLLFGRLRETHVSPSSTAPHGTIVVPKTLDDARRLVSPRLILDEDGTTSDASSPADSPSIIRPSVDERLLELTSGGRKPASQPLAREPSTDSIASTASGSKRVSFAEAKLARDISTSPASAALLPGPTSSPSSALTTPAIASPNGAVESIRQLGNSLNPLNRLAGMSVMRGFGRSSTPPPPAQAASSSGLETSTEAGQAVVEKNAMSKMEPPVQRFLDAADAQELKIGDVADLLKEYQRLAIVAKEAGLW